MQVNYLKNRHIGLNAEDQSKMCQAIGVESVEQLIDQTMPQDIRLTESLDLDEPLTEQEHLDDIAALAAKNLPYKSLIGRGWYGTVTPAVIQRNVLENPVWYTSYTPYQAEVSQGRLEALFNFQTSHFFLHLIYFFAKIFGSSRFFFQFTLPSRQKMWYAMIVVLYLSQTAEIEVFDNATFL